MTTGRSENLARLLASLNFESAGVQVLMSHTIGAVRWQQIVNGQASGIMSGELDAIVAESLRLGLTLDPVLLVAARKELEL